ncbi:hypothetical protein DYB35_001596 [Aphanomyces astaci]|uniref:HECT-type E3 ubiquitin transferase n=1 Tax=Aphanomyces astaci TaxID=112090 RepID=A0A3R7BC18_APHAT|nr:hypothetical protein DYB35_001596 [Aphanomyces astaci]
MLVYLILSVLIALLLGLILYLACFVPYRQSVLTSQDLTVFQEPDADVFRENLSDSFVEQQLWVCSVCSFSNLPDKAHCDLCQTVRAMPHQHDNHTAMLGEDSLDMRSSRGSSCMSLASVGYDSVIKVTLLTVYSNLRRMIRQIDLEFYQVMGAHRLAPRRFGLASAALVLEVSKMPFLSKLKWYSMEVHRLWVPWELGHYYSLVGRVVGKALFEEQLLPVHLTLPLLKHILGVPISFSDLQFLDDELYQSLVWLKRCTSAADVEALALDFTVVGDLSLLIITVRAAFPPGGDCISVTLVNKAAYLDLVFQYHILDSVSYQLLLLLGALYSVVPEELLKVFDYKELELLLCGVPTVDVDDWQRHAQVSFLQEVTPPSRLELQNVAWFWANLHDLSNEQRAKLLQFVTGSSRVPAQGFKRVENSATFESDLKRSQMKQALRKLLDKAATMDVKLIPLDDTLHRIQLTLESTTDVKALDATLAMAMLQDLNAMKLTMETLKETGLGRSVNKLRKHPSDQVAAASQALVAKWKKEMLGQ